MLLSLLFQSPVVFIVLTVSLILSLSVHEFAHAFVADKLGDPTPRLLGRVTLNPLAHLDPLGSLLLIVAGFGWGRPVSFNPNNLTNPKRDTALIAFAGPFSNFAVATLCAGIIHLLDSGTFIGGVLYWVVFYNLVLGFFNLIPVFPLDGFKVAQGILPKNLAYQWEQMGRYGIYILLLLILTQTIGKIVMPALSFALSILRL